VFHQRAEWHGVFDTEMGLGRLGINNRYELNAAKEGSAVAALGTGTAKASSCFPHRGQVGRELLLQQRLILEHHLAGHNGRGNLAFELHSVERSVTALGLGLAHVVGPLGLGVEKRKICL
jgi:hypothetical protein